MGTPRDKYFAQVGGTEYVFSGARYIYDALKADLGIKKLTERVAATTLTSRSRPTSTPEEVRKNLPKIRIVLADDRAIVGGNATQENSTRAMDVYCDPDSVEKALLSVIGKTVNPPGVTGTNGRKKITDAYMPRRRYFV
ncbi:MAG: hypothetical protein AAFS06_05210 [Cyanobacteria bacterium J06631_12]